MKQPELLPGVRNEERPTPTFDLPFTLSAQPVKRGSVQAGLFGAGCTHNTMRERRDAQFAWECADCGYIYGKDRP